jgi:aminoglycoside 6'-N-acetyltransferase
MTILQGESVRLRPATLDDVPELARIRATPQVHRHWRGGDDMVAAVLEDFREQDSTAYVIELEGRVVGWIQWQAEEEPEYRHASMDIYVDPAVHGRGVGTDAVRTLARHLIEDHGTTASRSIPRPATPLPSARIPRWASAPSASSAAPNAAPTAPGTTSC